LPKKLPSNRPPQPRLQIFQPSGVLPLAGGIAAASAALAGFIPVYSHKQTRIKFVPHAAKSVAMSALSK
jgi:hypothetical protein